MVSTRARLSRIGVNFHTSKDFHMPREVMFCDLFSAALRGKHGQENLNNFAHTDAA
jgi:hypothetical protein